MSNPVSRGEAYALFTPLYTQGQVDKARYLIQDLYDRIEELEAQLTAATEAATAKERERWVKWVVDEVGYPYEVRFETEPPCDRRVIAGEWLKRGDPQTETADDYLQTMEWELGGETAIRGGEEGEGGRLS
jgi:hypothetical protein